MNEINPFLSVSRMIGDQYRKGARQARDISVHHDLQTALATHAVQYEAVTRQAAQQARLTERSEKNRSSRATEFFGMVHSHAQPGKPVSIKHGDIHASYTPAAPAVPAAPKPGRVPVKKNRGGKSPR
jgi:hypothetical protein